MKTFWKVFDKCISALLLIAMIALMVLILKGSDKLEWRGSYCRNCTHLQESVSSSRQLYQDLLQEQGEQLDTCKIRFDKAERLAIGSGPPILANTFCPEDSPEIVCHVFGEAEFPDIVAREYQVLRSVRSASWEFHEPCNPGMEALAIAVGQKCFGYWQRKEPLPRSLPP